MPRSGMSPGAAFLPTGHRTSAGCRCSAGQPSWPLPHRSKPPLIQVERPPERWPQVVSKCVWQRVLRDRNPLAWAAVPAVTPGCRDAKWRAPALVSAAYKSAETRAKSWATRKISQRHQRGFADGCYVFSDSCSAIQKNPAGTRMMSPGITGTLADRSPRCIRSLSRTL